MPETRYRINPRRLPSEIDKTKPYLIQRGNNLYMMPAANPITLLNNAIRKNDMEAICVAFDAVTATCDEFDIKEAQRLLSDHIDSLNERTTRMKSAMEKY